MKYWRDEIAKFCDQIEDEAEIPGAEPGWHRARRYTAKQIRRFAFELAEEIADDLPVDKFGH